MTVPSSITHLFRDCDITTIDPKADSSFILERLMPRSETSVRTWIQQTFEADTLAMWIYRDGARRLGPAEIDYWCRCLGVADELRLQWVGAAESRVRIR